MERGEDYEQEQMQFDADGNAYVDKKEDLPKEQKVFHNTRELRPEDIEFEKIPENLVSFKKGTEVLGYSVYLDDYAKYYLQDDVNAYRTEKMRGKRRCYCFDESFGKNMEKADLFVRGIPAKLNDAHPYFYTLKSFERKAKKTKRWSEKQKDIFDKD